MKNLPFTSKNIAQINTHLFPFQKLDSPNYPRISDERQICLWFLFAPKFTYLTPVRFLRIKLQYVTSKITERIYFASPMPYIILRPNVTVARDFSGQMDQWKNSRPYECAKMNNIISYTQRIVYFLKLECSRLLFPIWTTRF